MKEPVFINCKHCKGVGQREHYFFITHPEEFSEGEAEPEMIECSVCKGTGKVVLHED
jgi:DnaJ-class molecular chaperone